MSKIFFIAMMACLTAYLPAMACTTLLVTKGASQDGSVKK